MNTLNCVNCNKEFETKYSTGNNRGKFCSLSCASTYNNSHRKLSDAAKQNIGHGLKRYWDKHPEKRSINGINSSIGKHKGRIDSILSVSSRTACKILKRLNIGCCICGWKESTCDIHHINGKKIDNADEHWNLAYVCPNHHRMMHTKKLDKDKLTSLDKYIPENWRDFYYG